MSQDTLIKVAKKQPLNKNTELLADLFVSPNKHIPDNLPTLSGNENQKPYREKAKRLISILSEIEKEYADVQPSKVHSLDVSYSWVRDVLITMIKGTLPIEIETVGPYLAAHVSSEGTLTINMDSLPDDEAVGVELAVILRRIADEIGEQTRIVSLLDEYNTSDGTLFTEEQQQKYVLAVSDMLLKRGVIKESDDPGNDFVLIRESEQVKKIPRFIDELKKSNFGEIVVSGQDISFMPNKQFVDILGLNSKSRRKEFRKVGIKLVHNGRPLCQALDASSFLDPINKQYVHVVILDQKFAAEQDKTYALLRALNIVRQDRYHNIFFDSRVASSRQIIKEVLSYLLEQANDIYSSINLYSDWENFEPEEYVLRNYGKQILLEDKRIMNVVASALKKKFKKSSLSNFADIGTGPNLYPAMLVAPYLQQSAQINMLEYVSANRKYLTDAVSRGSRYSQDGIWKKFEEFMVLDSGDVYRGALDIVKKRANIDFGDIYKLPKDTYDCVTSYFVAESITDSKINFRASIVAMSQSLKSKGVLIVAHMVGSEGYYAGLDTHFPAVNLSVDDLEQAYKDAGLEFTITDISNNTHIPVKARTGYSGMALVVATRNQLNH